MRIRSKEIRQRRKRAAEAMREHIKAHRNVKPVSAGRSTRTARPAVAAKPVAAVRKPVRAPKPKVAGEEAAPVTHKPKAAGEEAAPVTHKPKVAGEEAAPVTHKRKAAGDESVAVAGNDVKTPHEAAPVAEKAPVAEAVPAPEVPAAE